jgi:hypothetical protein
MMRAARHFVCTTNPSQTAVSDSTPKVNTSSSHLSTFEYGRLIGHTCNKKHNWKFNAVTTRETNCRVRGGIVCISIVVNPGSGGDGYLNSCTPCWGCRRPGDSTGETTTAREMPGGVRFLLKNFNFNCGHLR